MRVLPSRGAVTGQNRFPYFGLYLWGSQPQFTFITSGNCILYTSQTLDLWHFPTNIFNRHINNTVPASACIGPPLSCPAISLGSPLIPPVTPRCDTTLGRWWPTSPPSSTNHFIPALVPTTNKVMASGRVPI